MESQHQPQYRTFKGYDRKDKNGNPHHVFSGYVTKPKNIPQHKRVCKNGKTITVPPYVIQPFITIVGTVTFPSISISNYPEPIPIADDEDNLDFHADEIINDYEVDEYGIRVDMTDEELLEILDNLDEIFS